MTEAEIMQTQEQMRLRPGARRRREPMKATAVMLQDGERMALDGLADELGRSRSDLIREAVQRVWLKNSTAKVKGRKSLNDNTR